VELPDKSRVWQAGSIVNMGTKSADSTDVSTAGGTTTVSETVTFPAGQYALGTYTVRVVNRSNFSARSNGVCDDNRITPYTVTATIGSTLLGVVPATGPGGAINFVNYDARFGDGFYSVTVV
jgi:hypothetical protein